MYLKLKNWKMTLPIQPFSTDKSCLRGGVPLRRKVCFSAAWAEVPIRKEKRRAIYSWSVGYGSLRDQDQLSQRRGNVADNATLLEPRGRSLVHFTTNTAITHASSLASHKSGSKVDVLAMPGLKTLVSRQSSDSETETPLVKQNGTNSNTSIKPASSMANLRKYETVLGLTEALRSSSSSSSSEPLQPTNRLRVPQQDTASRFCSRCSSILTLASTSRYSLNSSIGGFVPIVEDKLLLCKLCLVEVPCKDACCLEECKCSFCSECMHAYVEFEIGQGAYDISCPDALCLSKGMLHEGEIRRLAGDDLFSKHRKYRLNREIELDKTRTWCPRAGCETVCNLCPTQQCQPQSIHCPNCTTFFCSNCKLDWHEGISCEDNNKKLAKEGRVEEVCMPFNSDLIKCCPMCNVPIEKDEGCAQMRCKRCKHVFCWYCLASLDDDFLLRHYDKGPCKNKLGHSRASVIWHRTQVIGIFAGIGILLLVASPLLLLAAPCILCCKCRVCNAEATKLNNDDVQIEEP